MADPHDPFPACDVCGRTILKGEQVHEYMTAQRDRIRVCVLCRARAEGQGWIPLSMAHTVADDEPRRSRGLALRQRLSRAASRARSSARTRRGDAAEREDVAREEQPLEDYGPVQGEASPMPEWSEAPAGATPEPEPIQAPEAGPEPEAATGAEAQPAPPPPRPARPRKQAKARPKRQPRATGAKRGARSATEGATPVRKSPAKRGPEALMRRAVERFNSSEERRKVAGLMRSLGEPQAGVRPDPRRQLALVTVAWELSWYQWEVGADGDADDVEPVREVAKGAEVSELDEEARAWNAAVDEDGTLRLRSAERRAEAAKEA